MYQRVRRIVGKTLWVIVVVGLIAGGVLGYWNRQMVQDHFAANDFKPDIRVQQVVTDLDLTVEGERVMLATHPTIDGRQNFNQKCSRSNHTNSGHLLGCYVDQRIHLFEVNDDRLDGVVEVTAAHELLHATYARLNQRDKEALAKRLTEVYELIIEDNQVFEQRMEVYEHLSASSFANELHSVLGTEMHDLPDWLEEHYQKWFDDRSAIVDWFDSYNSVFTSLKAEAEALQEKLDASRIEIEDESAVYSQLVEQFNEEWTQFTIQNDSYGFSDDPQEFYRIRDAFDDRRERLDSWREQIEEKIAQYEVLRLELTEIGELSTDLNSQIDSNLLPAEGSQ